jgi:regulator of sigma E protease
MTVLQAQFFVRMLTGQVSVKNLSGPISIAEYAGDSATQGFTSFLSFLVLISLSLGFLNLLPIPILDGGQIVYAGAEWIKGSPLSERVQALGQQVGLALLVLLMGMAFFNDISRTLLGG